jgi:hypothetical protein
VFFRDDLKAAQRRAIVQLDKRKILRIAPGSHPALDLIASTGSVRCKASFTVVRESCAMFQIKRLLQTFA